MDGQLVACVGLQLPLREHIEQTLGRITGHAPASGKSALQELAQVLQGGNDASWLRESYARVQQLPEVVRQASLRFAGRP